ncbi:Putative histidine phosphatase superfamily, clade-2, histidine acid phosphatase active [Septoria linicola]|uniref:Phytase A n=1 Tax=Septoria linicola TaxID=215465 RepID=A0A9Q9EG99_9PEZI|nr:Putative histidine phosphatase superfamily, clade-2, histidine acid phosphatase active [Septoria linicola]
MSRLRGLLPLSQRGGRYGETYKYARLNEEDGYSGRVQQSHSKKSKQKQNSLVNSKAFTLLIMVLLLATAAGLLVSGSFAQSKGNAGCDSVQKGYQCRPEISHYWGQYSPFYSVDSEISPDVPLTCAVTFAQVLSRHGARDPTASKTKAYNATIQKIHANVKTYPGKYAFLQNYQYTLGADQLTLFGEQEMINSGAKFYQRYKLLTSHLTPFIRSASEDRVVESALNFTQGFHAAKTADVLSGLRDPAYPYPLVVISEAAGSNNTLNHGLCTAFENGPDSTIASNAQKTWANTFVPAIQTRINNDLQGASLTVTEIIYLMDQCPFNTVASPSGAISSFCDLFTENEWHQYNYYQTLNKYYGYSYGNPLGPTQGVGFTNELIARLTNTAVNDHTSSNHTLDDNAATFPLRRQLYADFSHDNDMTAMYSAIGLFPGNPPLSNTTVTEAGQANGYSASYTVPFAARVYFEKLLCAGSLEEQVRVIVNDRVQPLKQCGGDRLGRCSLSKFVQSLSFASSDGEWDQCFA